MLFRSKAKGGVSRPRGGAWYFVASRELVPVTVILPPFAFGGTRRGSGGGDVKVSPHVHHSLSVRPPSSTLAVAGYEWVRDDVLKYKLCLTSAASVVMI